jgi:hypothetical protein
VWASDNGGDDQANNYPRKQATRVSVVPCAWLWRSVILLMVLLSADTERGAKFSNWQVCAHAILIQLLQLYSCVLTSAYCIAPTANRVVFT